MKKVDWSQFKAAANLRKVSIQFLENTTSYKLELFDNFVHLSCYLTKENPNDPDLVDFETNFKPTGNKSQPQQLQPFASKTLPNGKSLFKRFTGANFELSQGENIFTWTQSDFSWVKFLGIEIINGEIGDTCDLFVLDTTTGTYSGYANYPLNQFAFNANIAPTFYKHVSEYDADMYQNLQIKFVYTSVSAKTLYINFDMNEVK